MTQDSRSNIDENDPDETEGIRDAGEARDDTNLRQKLIQQGPEITSFIAVTVPWQCHQQLMLHFEYCTCESVNKPTSAALRDPKLTHILALCCLICTTY